MATVTLMESGGKSRGSGGTGTTVLSMIVHGALIGAAVLYTLHASIPKVHEESAEHKVIFVTPPPPQPIVKQEVTPKAPPPKPVQKSPDKRVFVAPKALPTPAAIAIPTITTIPTTIAPPNLDIPPTIFNTTGKGDINHVGSGGTGTGTGTAPADGIYTSATVDVEARADPSRAVVPTYPSSLQSAGVQGTVVARFVVDQDGKVDMSTFKVISSSNDQFTDAVKSALRRTRYIPAQSGGKTVRQLVQQPFTFRLN